MFVRKPFPFYVSAIAYMGAEMPQRRRRIRAMPRAGTFFFFLVSPVMDRANRNVTRSSRTEGIVSAVRCCSTSEERKKRENIFFFRCFKGLACTFVETKRLGGVDSVLNISPT